MTSSNRAFSGPASMTSTAEALDSGGGARTGGRSVVFQRTVTVVMPTANNNDNAQAVAGRTAQPVQRRTVDSRWMERDNSSSRTDERNCAQSGSRISVSRELISE